MFYDWIDLCTVCMESFFVRPRSDTHVSVKFSSHFSYIHVCRITQTSYFYQILFFVHVVYNAGSMRNGYTFVWNSINETNRSCMYLKINKYILFSFSS